MGMAMPGRDRLDLVTLLARIAETKSLSAAARAVGMSQPSASRLLKQLEALVGATLVHRSPSQDITLTSAGERFLASARKLVGGWDQAVAGVRAERDQLEGLLRVVAPVAAGQDLLAKIAARFIRANPGVTVEWRLSDDAVDPTPGGYDLWIRAGDLPTDDLVVREIWRIERAIVAAPSWLQIDHPSELLGDRAVRLTTFTPQAVELTRRDGETFQLRQRSVFMTDNLFSARAAVLEGVGYAVLPLWAVQDRLRRRVAGQALPRMETARRHPRPGLRPDAVAAQTAHRIPGLHQGRVDPGGWPGRRVPGREPGSHVDQVGSPMIQMARADHRRAHAADRSRRSL